MTERHAGGTTDGTERQFVRVERVEELAVLRLARGKGNSLSPAFVEELLDVLRTSAVADANGLLITGDGRFFSTGLDLLALEKLDRAGMLLFLDRLQGLLAQLYVWPRPVVAALNGHAVAGGCLLAMCADWRVLAKGEARVGLTESTLGLPLPQAGLEITRAQLTPAAWAQVVYGGQTHVGEQALSLGLADELAEPDKVIDIALDRLRQWARNPPVALHFNKAAARDPVLLRIRNQHDSLQEAWVDLWFSPPAQQRLAEVREKLQSKKG
ncbi:MAG: enoyl-CoA hydratase/isomerase family protein [Planctomycetes bacterium]|nr:enoyl-CoA hydratase/isomerase family protein [Planctomycetota bacterium]